MAKKETETKESEYKVSECEETNYINYYDVSSDKNTGVTIYASSSEDSHVIGYNGKLYFAYINSGNI